MKLEPLEGLFEKKLKRRLEEPTVALADAARPKNKKEDRIKKTANRGLARKNVLHILFLKGGRPPMPLGGGQKCLWTSIFIFFYGVIFEILRDSV